MIKSNSTQSRSFSLSNLLEEPMESYEVFVCCSGLKYLTNDSWLFELISSCLFRAIRLGEVDHYFSDEQVILCQSSFFQAGLELFRTVAFKRTWTENSYLWCLIYHHQQYFQTFSVAFSWTFWFLFSISLLHSGLQECRYFRDQTWNCVGIAHHAV